MNHPDKASGATRTEPSATDKRIIKTFLIVQGTLTLILAAVFVFMLRMDERLNTEKLMLHEVMEIENQRREISIMFDNIVSDLIVLSEANALKRLIRSDTPEARAAVAENMLSASRAKKLYDQIRYIDAAGNEVVRVNYNAGAPAMVPQGELQNKKGRYYFDDTMKLGRGEVFVSPLDLNIEHNQIELPFKPMIRFGMPVLDSGGRKRGAVILNYLAGIMLQEFKSEDEQHINSINMLVNNNGYWLLAPDPADEWGFMLKSGRNFASKYPAAWNRILASDDGQFMDSGALFTFSTIYPLEEGMRSSTGSAEPFAPSRRTLESGEYFWKSVRMIPERSLAESADKDEPAYFRGFLAMLLVTLVFSWLYSLSYVRRISAMSALERSLEEKDMLIHEVHHRVKNNLNTISALLSLQAYEIGDSKARAALTEAEGRVKSMIMIHRMLQNSEDIRRVQASEYMDSLAKSIFENMKVTPNHITLVTEFEQMSLNVDVIVPLALLVNEIVTNSLKHAFPGGMKGEVRISLVSDGQWYVLKVSDNGKGMPEGIGLDTSISLGLRLVHSLAQQLMAELDIEREGGTTFTIRFHDIEQDQD